MPQLTSAEQIEAAIQSTRRLPAGQGRSARAEEIVEAASSLSDVRSLVESLCLLIHCYEYGAERVKIPVPFARLLQLLDSKPESFSDWALRQTQWYFKWVTDALTETPDASLDAVRGWIREMERRYRIAGFSMRTIAAQDLQLSLHIGDASGVQAALARMLSLPRDSMSDCAACEANAIGTAHVMTGHDDAGMAAWHDVISGKLRCSEEPERVLAHSLLPLLRLGRDADARANHLRGYQLSRGNANIVGAIAEHIEFCALTGYEARGLEILAESRQLLSVTDPRPRLRLLTGAAVLLQRVARSGRGDAPVLSGTAASLLTEFRAEAHSLAARFDARNGTSAVTGELRASLERESFTGTRPETMGTFAVGSDTVDVDTVAPDTVAPDTVAPDTVAAGTGTLDSLISRARELDAAGHPDADSLWAQVAAATATSPVDGVLAGELAGYRASQSAQQSAWPDAVAESIAAAERFAAADLPGRAAAAAARATWAAAMADPCFDPWPEFDTQLARAQEHFAAGLAEPRDLLTVRHARSITAMKQLAETMPAAVVSAEIEAFKADAEDLGSVFRQAIGEAMLGEIDRQAGDHASEIARLRRAVQLLREAQRPWAMPSMLGRLGHALMASDPVAAIAPLEEALAVAARWPTATADAAAASMQLAHAYSRTHEAEAAVRYARDAQALFERAGESLAAAQAKCDVGLFLRAAGRGDEAIMTLSDAIPGLAEGGGAEAAAGARTSLGQMLRQSGDVRGAAEQFALAADALQAGAYPDAYLFSCSEAAACLADAGMWDAAHLAYQRALDEATLRNVWPAVMQLHRELIMVAARDNRNDKHGRVISHADNALAAAQRAASEAASELANATGRTFDLVRERGLTRAQAGRALAGRQLPEEALDWFERAVADLAADDASIEALVGATQAAARAEAGLGRAGSAQDRLTDVIQRCNRLGYDAGAALLTRLSAQLKSTTK
jgi:hypothetical protein